MDKKVIDITKEVRRAERKARWRARFQAAKDWELRRKLNNREWTEIDQRMSNGERMSDILNDLGVLK